MRRSLVLLSILATLFTADVASAGSKAALFTSISFTGKISGTYDPGSQTYQGTGSVTIGVCTRPARLFLDEEYTRIDGISATLSIQPNPSNKCKDPVFTSDYAVFAIGTPSAAFSTPWLSPPGDIVSLSGNYVVQVSPGDDAFIHSEGAGTIEMFSTDGGKTFVLSGSGIQ
jgi:hypothetical protein